MDGSSNQGQRQTLVAPKYNFFWEEKKKGESESKFTLHKTVFNEQTEKENRREEAGKERVKSHCVKNRSSKNGCPPVPCFVCLSSFKCR